MNLPPHVEAHGKGYRGRKRIEGLLVRTRTFPTPEDAYQAIIRVITEYRTAPEDVLSLREAGERLLRHTEKVRTEATAKFYRQTLGYIYRELGETTPLFSIGRDDIQELVHKWTEETSPATALVRFRVVRRLMLWAVRQGWIRSSPHVGVDLRRVPRREMAWFTGEQIRSIVARILEAEKPTSRRDADLILLIAQTGLRRSEVARLRVQDISGGHLWVRGKVEERRVPVRAALSDVLERLVDGRSAGPLIHESPSVISHMVERWRVNLPEPSLHPHALRHAFIFMLVDAGVPVNRVAELAGHRTIGTTMKYFHARSSGLRDAVEGLPELD